MTINNAENIETTIKITASENDIHLQEGDIEALRKAYVRFGDVDLALNSEGDVLSDVMEETQLDIIAEALNKEFGTQGHTYPYQIYPVKINGHTYKTYVDEHGDQRFRGNKILNQHLPASLPYEEERQAYLDGDYTTEEWVEFNYIIGSKLKDFMLTLNTSIEIENPRETI
jgi:hypothetical protein